jgi:hypothetical protein
MCVKELRPNIKDPLDYCTRLRFLSGNGKKLVWILGVFGLTFGFGFCPPKSQKPTKGLDPGSSFF